MRDLNTKHVYDLSELTSEERKEVEKASKIHIYNYRYLVFSSGWFVCSYGSKFHIEPTNAKELFYTLENVQVDCQDLSSKKIKELSDICLEKGYNYWDNSESGSLQVLATNTYFQITEDREIIVDVECENKTTITYEKFMELFGSEESNFKKLVEVLNEELTEEAYKETQYEVKYIAEKPKQYQIGIDTFNPQPHYNNKNGSLYKIANNLGLNHWEFDIFKRLVRCRKKNQFKEDLQKIKDTIDIYLNEYLG